jgi:hypothetical protein
MTKGLALSNKPDLLQTNHGVSSSEQTRSAAAATNVTSATDQHRLNYLTLIEGLQQTRNPSQQGESSSQERRPPPLSHSQNSE